MRSKLRIWGEWALVLWVTFAGIFAAAVAVAAGLGVLP